MCAQGIYRNNRAGRAAEYILFDPAIHCPVDVMRFTHTNLADAGMDQFFMVHKCNHICKALGLEPHYLQPPEPGADESSGRPFQSLHRLGLMNSDASG
jgi:hypothetical protein